jgi:hypothetical protein
MLQLFCKRFERERVRNLYSEHSRYVFLSTKENVFLRIRKVKHFPAIKHYFFL